MIEDEFASLNINGQEFQLPIKKSTCGPDVIDISSLYKISGYFTYDPGFMSTASCSSEITFIDGNKSILKHRGYNIEDLAENCDFLEIVFLLLYKKLPNRTEYNSFSQKILENSLVNENLFNIFDCFSIESHPMSILISAMGAMSSFYWNKFDSANKEEREAISIIAIAQIPIIAVMIYKYLTCQKFIYPSAKLGYAENFLYMIKSSPMNQASVDAKIFKILSKALNKVLILHADHEQNASTSTVRTVASSGTNLFACLSSGVSSLWGHLHGGANEAVVKMLEQIQTVENIPFYIKKAKSPEDDFRLMGFGHRVYKNFDPRARVLKDNCTEILKNISQEMSVDKNSYNKLMIAQELEKIALNEEYFITRKLYPNVDFYSGIIYETLGIPSRMFTVMFAIARCAGWVAQWNEFFEEGDLRLSRPRQLYKGSQGQKFIKMKDR